MMNVNEIHAGAAIALMAASACASPTDPGASRAALDADAEQSIYFDRAGRAVLRAARGHRVSFFLSGDAFDEASTIVVGSGDDGTTAELGDPHAGGRWVSIDLDERAPDGLYPVTAYDARGRLVAVTLWLQPELSSFMGNVGAVPPEALREDPVTRRFDEPLRTPSCGPNGISFPSRIDVEDHSPEGGAEPGGTLLVTGERFPEQGSADLEPGDTTSPYLDVVLDGEVLLDVIDRSSEHIRVRLPDEETTGDLRVVARAAGDAPPSITGDVSDFDLRAEPCPPSGADEGDYAVPLSHAYTLAYPLPFEAFDGTSTEDSLLRDGYLFSLLSWLGYFDPAPVDAEAEALGLTHEAFIEDEVVLVDIPKVGEVLSNQAHIFTHGDDVFVSLRGTQLNKDTADVLVDIGIRLVPPFQCEGGCPDDPLVHAGFWTSAERMSAILAPLLEDLLEARGPDARLFVTGHSLGGAMALLTSYRLAVVYGLESDAVHAFGAPWVGNQTFAEHHAATLSEVHRWEVERDAIPGLLRNGGIVSFLGEGYAPIGALHRLEDDDDVVLNSPFLFDRPDCLTETTLAVVFSGACDTNFVTCATALAGGTQCDEITDLVTNDEGWHMSYWCRLHDALIQAEGDLALGAPTPEPPGPGLVCEVQE